MKKYILSLILLVLCPLAAVAQNYVIVNSFRGDGYRTKSIFAKDAIDSIKFDVSPGYIINPITPNNYPTPITTEIEGLKFIDLGLPSGKLWSGGWTFYDSRRDSTGKRIDVEQSQYYSKVGKLPSTKDYQELMDNIQYYRDFKYGRTDSYGPYPLIFISKRNQNFIHIPGWLVVAFKTSDVDENGECLYCGFGRNKLFTNIKWDDIKDSGRELCILALYIYEKP